MFVLRLLRLVALVASLSLFHAAGPARAVSQMATDRETISILIGGSRFEIPKTFDGVPLLNRYMFRGGSDDWRYATGKMPARGDIDAFYDRVQTANLSGRQDGLVLIINVTPAYLRSIVPKPAHPGGFQLIITEVTSDLKGRLPPLPTADEALAIKAWMQDDFPKLAPPDGFGLADPDESFLRSDLGVPDALLNVTEPPNVVSTSVEDFSPLGLPLVFNTTKCAGSPPCFSYLETKRLIITHAFWEEQGTEGDPATGSHVAYRHADFPRSAWRGLAQDVKAVVKDMLRR